MEGRNEINDDLFSNDRFDRYVEVENVNQFTRSVTINQIRPYFDGDSLHNRMDEIRKSIIHIRENWDNYSNFNESLRKYTDAHVKKPFAKEIIQSILLKKRDWSIDPVNFSDLQTIRLYTSSEGYKEIFSLINLIFRDSKSSDIEMIRTAVFLIELLNIELFLYCRMRKEVNNFTGTIYRGMALAETDYEAFDSLRNKDISNRYIATPLSLLSGSTNIEVAKKFIKNTMGENKKPLLMIIHIIELDKEFLDYYQKRFPTSVVSTICAVDISKISKLSWEQEVLLRGPFFQVLDLYDGDNIGNQKCRILEMVMLNSNRDHISTMQLGKDSDPARELFGTMVAVTRCKFAINYCKNKGLIKDEEDYNKMLNDKMEKLKTLMI